MHRIFVLAAAAVVCLALTAHAQEASRLPFPDGSYVTNPAFCRMSMQALRARQHERVGVLVRDIDGRRFNRGWEVNCQMQSLTVRGSTINVRATCDAEGTTEPWNETWIRLNERSFRVGRRTYVGCGQFIR